MSATPAALPNLSALRQQKKLTLTAVSESTKIATRYLEAIEQGQFGKLPGGVYSVSYIRQYAQAIDFDAEDLLASFYAATGSGPGQPFPIPLASEPVAPPAQSPAHWLRSLLLSRR